MENIKNIIYNNGYELSGDLMDYYDESYYIFENAEKILNTKLDIIKREYDKEKIHGDIREIKSRIKSLESISIKLHNDGLEYSEDNINTINDIIGARIICLDLDDVERVVEMIKSIPSIRIINEKDYIKHPKESGYRSYHIIVEYDVPAGENLIPMRAEIQVRTLLMDAWSSLEHEIIYKNSVCSLESERELKNFSFSLSSLENSMKSIKQLEINKRKDAKKRQINYDNLEEFKNNEYIYNSASEILDTYIDIVKKEYYKNGFNSDIQNYRNRVKTISSIDRKLESKGLEFNLENIQNKIKDMVACYVVCLDLDDVNEFVNVIMNSPFINVVQVKDYITNPKESGYRAYHIIVEVPVELSTGIVPVRCEIQVRTLLMDAWSSLEHETVYKNPSCSDESKSYLRDYSYLLADMDERMLKIKRIEIDNLLKHNEETNENVKSLSKVPKKG